MPDLLMISPVYPALPVSPVVLISIDCPENMPAVAVGVMVDAMPLLVVVISNDELLLPPVPIDNFLATSSHRKSALLDKVPMPVKNAPCPAVPLPPIFELNVLQSADETAPLLLALAVGRFNVCVLPELEIAKFVPLVPVAKVCVAPVWPFKSVRPVAGSATVPPPLLKDKLLPSMESV